MCNETTKPSERPNSVEVSVNAKGEVSYKVKCYADHGVDAYTEANQLVTKLEKNLPKKFKR